MTKLIELGWNGRIEREYKDLGLTGHLPGRVAAADRGQCVVLAETGARAAVTSGKLKHRSTSGVLMPAVGDWVVMREEAGSLAVEAILPRSSCLTRKASGRECQVQVIAVNLDKIFIVTAVGRDLSPRRIERQLAAAHSAGATPVVVINKKDQPHDREEIMAEIEPVALSSRVIMTSVEEDGGLSELEPLLVPGETVALIGSSGVGKSSMINRLIGCERQATLEIREADDKGRHATTRRELIVAPAGFLLIDTPGMREFGLWDAGEGLAETFADVVELSESCRFRDCTHQNEPDCAVIAASEQGLLPPGRLQSYLALFEEQQRVQQRAREREAKIDGKKRWKDIHKEIRRRKKLHEKLGLKK